MLQELDQLLQYPQGKEKSVHNFPYLKFHPFSHYSRLFHSGPLHYNFMILVIKPSFPFKSVSVF